MKYIKTIKYKIEEFEVLKNNIDTIIFMLEGGFRKQDIKTDGSINAELECYRNEGLSLQSLIDSLFQEHGNEELPTTEQAGAIRNCRTK